MWPGGRDGKAVAGLRSFVPSLVVSCYLAKRPKNIKKHKLHDKQGKCLGTVLVRNSVAAGDSIVI